MNKVKAAVAKLKEINWLYSIVDPDMVEKTGDEIVIDVAHSATSTMLEKASDKDEYCAGLQAIRHLDKPVPTANDIDQFKMVNVKEFPLKINQKHLDLMCFPELFPTGEFGEYHDREVPLTSLEYVKSGHKNKDSRYRKKAEYFFYLHDQKVERELKAGITNLLNNTRHKDRSVKQLITRAEGNDYELERCVGPSSWREQRLMP